MKKNIFGRKFKRDLNERNALFKGLLSSLVLYERIQTTQEKAKAIKGEVDKLVNKARSDKNSQRFLNPYLNQRAIKKLTDDISKRYNGRTSGYTRIVRLGNRFSDNARVVIMEWVEGKKAEGLRIPKKEEENKKTAKKTRVRAKRKADTAETKSKTKTRKRSVK